MNSDNLASASSSGTMSASKPDKPSAPPADAPAEKLSESDYLAQQAHNAQLAMSKALADIKVRLGQGVDPKAWAREHPWFTIAGAAVAGFVATSMIVPSPEQQALRKLAAIERALNPPPERGNGDSKGKSSMLGSILHGAFTALRPVVSSLMAAKLGGAMADGQPESPPDEIPPT